MNDFQKGNKVNCVLTILFLPGLELIIRFCCSYNRLVSKF